MVLTLSLMLVNVYNMKFHKDILNGFEVTERTRICDGQRDRLMDRPMDGTGRTDRQPWQKQYVSKPWKGET